jgi:hypothetical protein
VVRQEQIVKPGFSQDETMPDFGMIIFLEQPQSIQRAYLLPNWVEAQSYWAVWFAKTANAIGLLPKKRDTDNLQKETGGRS